MDTKNTYKNISLYKYFIFNKVLYYKDTAKAARHMRIPHFKLKNDLISIEKALGVDLFVRNKVSFTLTSEGEKFASISKNIARELDVLDIDSNSREGKLVIATYQGVAQNIFPKVLAKFYSVHPKVELVVLAGIENEEFLDPAIDVLISSHLSNRVDLHAKHLSTVPYYLYASPLYLEKYGTPHTLEELHNHKIISFSKMKYSNISPYIEIKPYIESIDYRVIYTLVKDGRGIAALPTSRLQKDDLCDKKLIKLMNGEKLTDFSIYFVTKRFSNKVNLTNELFDCIREALDEIETNEEEE